MGPLRRRTLTAPRVRRSVGVLALAVIAVFAGVASGEGSDPAIAVVVGRKQAPAEGVSVTLVAGIFARKRQLWNDRSTIVPVNLPAAHPLRRKFSLWVFGKSPEKMQDYWDDQYFHGVLPPPVLASEEAIIRFVASTPGAIGYVSACTVDKRVEVVALVQGPDGAAACPR
jgi:ABC-type phosphate transport system substrate-binding protein